MPAIILGITGSIYLVWALRVLRAGLAVTGAPVFPLDDTYIGMALARNLALHGVMGFSATHFASATSCPGFLLLLAGVYRLTGPNGVVAPSFIAGVRFIGTVRGAALIGRYTLGNSVCRAWGDHLFYPAAYHWTPGHGTHAPPRARAGIYPPCRKGP